MEGWDMGVSREYEERRRPEIIGAGGEVVGSPETRASLRAGKSVI